MGQSAMDQSMPGGCAECPRDDLSDAKCVTSCVATPFVLSDHTIRPLEGAELIAIPATDQHLTGAAIRPDLPPPRPIILA